MKKLLIAEDDKFLRNIYKVKLQKEGFEVMAAEDGEEATEILKDFTPDVFLLDLIMPVKDGFTVLSEIRKDSRYKNIPVIVASNLGQKEDVEKALKMGADDYIIKSDTSLADLISKLDTVKVK